MPNHHKNRTIAKYFTVSYINRNICYFSLLEQYVRLQKVWFFCCQFKIIRSSSIVSNAFSKSKIVFSLQFNAIFIKNWNVNLFHNIYFDSRIIYWIIFENGKIMSFMHILSYLNKDDNIHKSEDPQIRRTDIETLSNLE